MTSTAAPATTAEAPHDRSLRGWIRAKDPEYLTVKRSVRAAVVMPAVFWMTHVAFTNAQVSLFALCLLLAQ